MNDAKPILFNTDMVRAILDGRKTMTRRVVNHKHLRGLENLTAKKIERACKAPYKCGDVLYVRETWYKDAGRYMYRADYSDTEKFYVDGKEIKMRWCPSLHMPKDAARIFLRVTGVRVEQLNDIDEADAIAEGIYDGWRYHGKGSCALTARQAFMWLWHFITLDAPGWQSWSANPWVWVIEFERCEKP